MSAQVAHTKSDERQQRAFAWAAGVYGESGMGRRVLAFRGLEEFVELVQTQGLSLDDVIRTAKYVYERPPGDTKTEIGDVRLMVDIMAEGLGVSSDSCHINCLSRIQSLDPDKCRSKENAKLAYGLR